MDNSLRLMGFGGRVKLGLATVGRSRTRISRNGNSSIGRNDFSDGSLLLTSWKPNPKPTSSFSTTISSVCFSTCPHVHYGTASSLLFRSYSRRDGNGDESGSSDSGGSSAGRDSAAAAAAAASWSSNVAGSRGRRRPRRPQDFDAFGTWDSTTDLPLMVEASIAQGKPIPTVLFSSVGMSSVKGRRPYQEDQYGIEQFAPNLLYWAVFDGHGGSDCSRFCVQQMPRHIAYWIDIKAKEAAEAGSKELDLTAVLHNAFLEVNNSFARWYTFNRPGIEGDSSGTTATVVLLKDGTKLAVGHCGDSRAILCRSGEARKLTTDHVPTLITEKVRIEKSGGRISNSRVNERLAMTRSIGDLELKRYGVIAEPEVRIVDINHSRDAFLVLTTDGINSVMTDNEIIETVKQAEDPTVAAHLLTDTSVQYSSEDNSTAIVTPLGSWGKYSAAATIFHSFGKSFTSSSRFS